MSEGSHQRILRQYDERVVLHEELASKVQSLVAEMLRDQFIRVHSVTSRVKERESLRKKVSQRGKRYSELSDLTDIVGVRIITFFDDEVDAVARIIENEFSVDWANTTDKRAALDPDRFGYLTMQHVSELSLERIALLEYRRFKGVKFEIQTRSILQHAWAEIEHDLGYKNPLSIPREVRRRLSRLASLLEMGDEEFRRIRDELESYRRTVPRQIQEDPQHVEIDRDSLLAFIVDNPLVTELDEAICAAYKGTISPRLEYNRPDVAEQHVARLTFLGIRTIQELEEEHRRHHRKTLAYATAQIPNGKHSFSPGISLFYLAYVLADTKCDHEEMKRFLTIGNLRNGPSDDELLRELIYN